MLNPTLDLDALSREFQEHGRIQIRDVLEPDAAEAIYQCLHVQVPWTLAYIDGETSATLSEQQLNGLAPAEKAALQQRIHSRARDKFQFMYNSYMMVSAYKEGRNPELLLHRVLEYLNSEPYLDFARRVTGLNDIVRADAQATRYIPGHFLKNHNDLQENEGRLAAYVLGFAKDWQADWGGLLHFLDENGQVTDTFIPRFNSLTIFQVPVPHCVSYVAPFARQARYGITGWLRRWAAE